MTSGRLVVVVAGISLMLTSSASAGGRGAVVVRSSPRVVVVPQNRVFGPSHVFVRPEPSVFPRFVDPWRFWPPGTIVAHHGTVPVGPSFVSPGFVGGGTVVVAQPPPVYDPQPSLAVPDGSLSMPTLIEYPTGWYQLRGDGVTSPYVWFWIPKPPPPPAQPLPTVPPVPPPPPTGTLAPDAPMPRQALYRWVDEEGVAHWTDQRDGIPQRYRAQAERR